MGVDSDAVNSIKKKNINADLSLCYIETTDAWLCLHRHYVLLPYTATKLHLEVTSRTHGAIKSNERKNIVGGILEGTGITSKVRGVVSNGRNV